MAVRQCENKGLSAKRMRVNKKHSVFFSKHMSVNFNSTARLTLDFGSIACSALIDTGASCCLIDKTTYEKIQLINKKEKIVKQVRDVQMQALSASNQAIKFDKELRLHFKIKHLSWDFTFYLVNSLPVPVILGINFLLYTKSIINMADRTISFPYKQPLILNLGQAQESQVQCEIDKPKFGDNLNPQQRAELEKLLAKFPETITKKLGRTNLMTYKINIKPGHKVRCRPYQCSPIKTEELRQHIDELLKNGVIRESSSEFASPAFCVPKKGNKTRMVVNYRALNQGLTLEAMPTPTVESAFQHLAGAKYFTLLDLNSAYNQIPLAEESKALTSFVVSWQQYEYNYVPFGLANGAYALTALINKLFGDIKFKYVFAFFDDIVIYSKTFEEHKLHVEEALVRLKRAGLTINPAKMVVASSEIEFLGHRISNNTLSVDPEKTRPIDEFPRPKNIKQLARFLGMSAYYARFINNYAAIAAPLNMLKRKNVPFKWGTEQETAFNELKRALVQPTILKLPDFNKEFVLHTDASRHALGAVLSQEHHGQLLPVGFASRTTNSHEKRYDTMESEALGIVFALEKFRVYLEHRRFQLYTDNSALTWLLNHPKQIGKIARWITTINAFQFTISHIKGKDNVVADCLSRLFDENNDKVEGANKTTSLDRPKESQFMSINVLFQLPEAFADISTHQQSDPDIRERIKEVKARTAEPNFSIVDNILVYKRPNQIKPRVVIPKKLLPMLFKHYHEAPTAGHLGVAKTLHRVQAHFWSSTLKAEIADMVKSCKVCQLSKPARNTKVGQLVTEIAARPFERIYIDHVGPFPASKKGNKYILTVVDSFSKYAVFIPARNTAAKTTVHLLKTALFAYFGFPRYLITDNVPGLRSKDMTQMCMEYGITQITTTPYHPQSNQVERVNQGLVTALRAYHSNNHTQWDTMLHFFQISYNSAVHTSTKQSPASIFLGYNIRQPLELAWNLEELLAQPLNQPSTEQKWAQAFENMNRAKIEREQRFNQGRKQNPFKVGEWVTYRLNRQSKKVDKITAKLLPLYSEPCVIQAFTSPVSVILIDPKTGQVVRRAHITQLKRYFQPANM